MINKTVLQGRLTADPELRQTGSGTSVASFTIAWSEKYKDKETTLFLPCTAWSFNADFISKYFTKGQEIAVEGRLVTHAWDDKDGNHRSRVEMTVDRAHFCGKKESGTPAAQSDAPEIAYTDDGDLPF